MKGEVLLLTPTKTILHFEEFFDLREI